MTGSAERAALYDSFAQVGKALANGRRLELLEILAQGERSVDALAHAAGMPLTSVSAHLQILKQAGVLTARREGIRIHYGLAGDDVAALYSLLQQVAHSHLAEVEHACSAHLGPADTESITRQELLDRMDHEAVVILDVRTGEEYEAGHIPDAISMPLDTVDTFYTTLPSGCDLVAYGRSANCILAYRAARLLAAHRRPAMRLADGMLEWRAQKLPVDTGLASAPSPSV